MMKLIIIIATLVILSVGIPQSFACTCIADPDYNEIVKESDVAFIGQVISKEKEPIGGSANIGDKVEFKVFTGIKNIDTSTFEFTQYNHEDSSCGIDYKIDEVYFVSYSETYQTNLCSTRPLSDVGHMTFENGVEIVERQVVDGFVVSESTTGGFLTWGLIPLGILIVTLIWLWRKSKQT